MCSNHPSAFFSLSSANLSSCPRLRGTQGARPDPIHNLGPGRGPWHVLWRSKVIRPLGEAFRAFRAVQAHANPCTEYIIHRLKEYPTTHVISGNMNVINVVRHYMTSDGKVFPRHQHVRHSTIYIVLNWLASLFCERKYKQIDGQPSLVPPSFAKFYLIEL